MSSPLWGGLREGCGSCEFGGPRNPNDMLQCRRHPPTLVTLRIPNLEYDVVEQHQPWMAQSDWCGEYKRKITDVPASAA